MTQTLRRPPRQNPGVRRRGAVYLFKTLCVHESGPRVGLVLDGSTEDGYVGKTRQTLAQREQQHRGGSADGGPVRDAEEDEEVEEQPWWDLTVGGIQLLEKGNWTDDELAKKEVEWIHRIRPQYNYVDNLDNERRIPKFTAREHRDNRDRAKGLTPRQWQPFATQRGIRIDPAKLSRQPARKSQHLPVKWRRRRNWTLAWAGTVAMLWAALILLDAAWLHWPVPALDWLDLSAGAVTALYVKLHVGRKKRRKLAWALTGAATLILAAWITKG